MPAHFPVAAITDEFSPDIETAVRSMTELGMTGAELRMVFGKNIVDLSDEELERAIAIVRGAGLEIVSIASPLLKCVLPDSPEVDARFQQDMFAAKHTFADQPRLTARALEIAERTGARIIRVFSYWRTVDPEVCFSPHRGSLARPGRPGRAAQCDHRPGKRARLQYRDRGGDRAPAGGARSPQPESGLGPGQRRGVRREGLPRRLRQAAGFADSTRACQGLHHGRAQAVWCAIGEGVVGWRGQVDALVRDGYQGWLSLETHWPGPGGNKHEASMICGRKLVELAR